MVYCELFYFISEFFSMQHIFREIVCLSKTKKFLIEKKYIYRDKKGKLMPYADKNNGLFEVKECYNEKTNWSGSQTLITPKGRETFRLLFLKVS